MARKTITQKEQIPKWYTKRIKGFENLKQSEALFEYESLKLRERQRKTARKLGIKDYKAPSIPRPSYTTSSNVETLRQITSEEIKHAVKYGQRVIEPYSSIYDYEPEWWKEEQFPGYVAAYEPDYSWDTEYDDYEEPSVNYTPEPEPIEESLDDYFVDPTTGEAIPKSNISSLADRGREFLERLVDYAREIRDQTIINHSVYPNGRTRNARSRSWMEQNVERATNKVIDRLQRILGDEEECQKFAERAMYGDYMATLQNSIGAFVTAAYKSPATDGNNWAELDSLLNDVPLSMEDLSYMDDFDDSWFEEDGY